MAESYCTGGKNGTFLTTLLYIWQQTRLPSVLLLLTVKCSEEGVGSKVYREVLEKRHKSSFVPTSTCHRHGIFPHMKPCKMHQVMQAENNTGFRRMRGGCPDALCKPQRSKNSECPTLGFMPDRLALVQPSVFASPSI